MQNSISLSYTVYILRTSRNTLYTGQTHNLDNRLKEHASHTNKSSKYMRSFASFQLVYAETHATRSEALKREAEIKDMTKKQKETLIASHKLASRSILN